MSNIINTGNKIEKFRTGFQLVLVTILSFIIIPLVLYLIFRKRVYDQNVIGTILHVSNGKCESNCEALYEYNNNETGTSLLTDNNKRSGDPVTVYYDPENPEISLLKNNNEDEYSQTEGKIIHVSHPGSNSCKSYTVNVQETTKVNGVTRKTNRTVTKYICHITYEYTVKGKKYFKEYTKNTNKMYKAGDDINVYYESKNPANSTFSPDDYRMIGGVVSSVFTLIVLGLSAHYFMVSKVKGYGSMTLASRTLRSLKN